MTIVTKYVKFVSCIAWTTLFFFFFFFFFSSYSVYKWTSMQLYRIKDLYELNTFFIYYFQRKNIFHSQIAIMVKQNYCEIFEDTISIIRSRRTDNTMTQERTKWQTMFYTTEKTKDWATGIPLKIRRWSREFRRVKQFLPH